MQVISFYFSEPGAVISLKLVLQFTTDVPGQPFSSAGHCLLIAHCSIVHETLLTFVLVLFFLDLVILSV